MGLPLEIVIGCWVVFVVYWPIAARDTKKNVYQRSPWQRLIGPVLAVSAIEASRLPALERTVVPQGPITSVAAVSLCIGGIAFAIWARRHLGRNWSSLPSLKEGHELVTSGPYRFVRHPIYTGILIAMLGSALVTSLAWVIAFALFWVLFLIRTQQEERLMLRQFPDEYPSYRTRTKRLIPMVW